MSEISINTLKTMLANLDDAKKYQSLRDVMETLPAPDLAAVFEDLPAEKLPVLFRLCPKDLAADVFTELTPETQGDINGDGVITYIMCKGDPENIDAQYRTEYSIKALEDAGKKVNCLYEYLDNWDQTTAQQDVANALSQYGDQIEVVFCNNDAMALGALQSIQQAGRTVGKDIYLVGVDALAEAVQDVLDGNMTGTVLNDDVGQATAAAEATKLYVEGSKVEQYYWVDYVKVTKDNASSYVK